MATYVGQCACQQCGDPVQVYTDRAGMAYYRCGPCGAHVRQTKPTKNRRFLESIERHVDEDDAAANPGKTPESAAPPAPAVTPEKPSETPKKRSIFMGL
ncbi:MAG: hypothetical protein QM625_22680 [Ralstonia sp.]|uniref:hypothetical protein n=1 Tax=Ralstonia TaxID=48736 RepID=UPI0015C8A793|nr:hypothetical protein [Ralstonia pickettii]MBX3880390.1 hypothetical protein [Ralstonia pickettii]MBX3949471.1 hypothetical protein [Ralstonia pickettii]NYS10716.1 hypothetical protein [Ralstonia pickettii]